MNKMVIIWLIILMLAAPEMAADASIISTAEIGATAHVVSWMDCAQIYSENLDALIGACGEPDYNMGCFSSQGYGDTSC